LPRGYLGKISHEEHGGREDHEGEKGGRSKILKCSRFENEPYASLAIYDTLPNGRYKMTKREKELVKNYPEADAFAGAAAGILRKNMEVMKQKEVR